MTREDEIQARLDAAHDTPWQPYFNIHADPYVVSDPDRPVFTTVATVSTHPSDYGRANAILLGNAPDDIRYLLDKVANQERHITLLRSMLLAEQNKAAAGQVITYHMQQDSADRPVQNKLEEKADDLEEEILDAMTKPIKPTVVGSTTGCFVLKATNTEEIARRLNDA